MRLVNNEWVRKNQKSMSATALFKPWRDFLDSQECTECSSHCELQPVISFLNVVESCSCPCQHIVMCFMDELDYSCLVSIPTHSHLLTLLVWH